MITPLATFTDPPLYMQTGGSLVVSVDKDTVILAAPLVTALVESAKRGGLPDNLAGSAAIVFAFAIVALLSDDPYSREAALTAIATGLAASGLYSQIRHFTRKAEQEPEAIVHAAD